MNNEKFLNQTGLSYYHDRAKTVFENKIEKVKVNGTEQTITNKEVDLDLSRYGKVNDSQALTAMGKQHDEYRDFFELKSVGIGNGYMGISQFCGNQDGSYSPVIAPSKAYVDSKGSVEIDSSNNNKTTFTNGSKTSSLATNPDGVIYTEGATDVQLASKYYVDDAIAGVTGMEFVQVDTLPAEGEKGKIYLVPNGTASSNIKDEYIWIQDGPNGRFEKIGSTDIDLSNYYNTTNLVAITTAEIDALFA